jgi:glycyl-tRNA synthetase beta chain
VRHSSKLESTRRGAKKNLSIAYGDFLLEVGCEEIPGGMIARASSELKVLLEKYLLANALVEPSSASESIEAFGAPRRLIGIVHRVRLRQKDSAREIVGPPKSIAFDPVGAPTRAAQSFAEKLGVSVSDLRFVAAPKGECVAVVQAIAGRPAEEILAETLPQVIQEISWPRSMYWTGANGTRFIRPIRWITALLDGKVVRFRFAGVNSDNRTEGHRFLGKSGIRVYSPSDYLSELKKNFVLARPQDRRKKIESEIRALAAKRHLRAREDSSLLGLVTYLNEYPTVVSGDFDPAFLSLPEEILVTVMRDHQKYFALETRDGGLAPHFLAVINLPRDPKGLVRSGHERVLRARFADARFFWETDQKTRLAAYLPKLAAVTYESRLGSYRNKVERMRAIARWLAEQWFSAGVTRADVAGADRAAELAKCDLVTEMVREFPELQGIVGGLYARAQGEPEEIAWAVYDHYRPAGLDDPLPRNLTGCTVSFADKLDSLVACFAVGATPTGSSDPFALRRAALGIIKIILEKKLPLSLSAAVSAAARALHEHPPKIQAGAELEKQVLDFLLERQRFVLRERYGYAYDEINAVFAAGADDLGDAVERIAAVRAIRHTRDFAPLAAAFKRIRNILEKSVGKADRAQTAAKPELFREAAEKELYEAAQEISLRSTQMRKIRHYQQALETIGGLRAVVDRFFDKVLVMAEEEEVRRNRIALLGGLLKEFSTIADFSEIGSEQAKEDSASR